MLWSEGHGGRILRHLVEIRKSYIISLSIVILIFISLFTFRRPRRVVYFSMFTTGFSSMAFMLAIILAYQAFYGYVYEMIGILAAHHSMGVFCGGEPSFFTHGLKK